MKELNIENLRKDAIYYAEKYAFGKDKEMKEMVIDEINNATEDELIKICEQCNISVKDYYYELDDYRRKKRNY